MAFAAWLIAIDYPIDVDCISGEVEEGDATSSSPQNSASDSAASHQSESKAGQDRKHRKWFGIAVVYLT